MGIQVSLWESSPSVLQHLIPSPGCKRGSGTGPQARTALVALGRAAGEGAKGQHHALSFLCCGSWSSNGQHAWFGERRYFPPVHADEPEVLVPSEVSGPSLCSMVTERLGFPSAGPEEGGGQRGPDGAHVTRTPCPAAVTPRGVTLRSLMLLELRGSLAPNPQLPWSFPVHPTLTPALRPVCCRVWAAAGCPGALPSACGELPRRSWSWSWSCSLQLPGAWPESREAACQVLAKPQLGAFCHGRKSWLSPPPALGNVLLQGHRETHPRGF